MDHVDGQGYGLDRSQAHYASIGQNDVSNVNQQSNVNQHVHIDVNEEEHITRVNKGRKQKSSKRIPSAEIGNSAAASSTKKTKKKRTVRKSTTKKKKREDKSKASSERINSVAALRASSRSPRAPSESSHDQSQDMKAAYSYRRRMTAADMLNLTDRFEASENIAQTVNINNAATLNNAETLHLNVTNEKSVRKNFNTTGLLPVAAVEQSQAALVALDVANARKSSSINNTTISQSFSVTTEEGLQQNQVELHLTPLNIGPAVNERKVSLVLPCITGYTIMKSLSQVIDIIKMINIIPN